MRTEANADSNKLLLTFTYLLLAYLGVQLIPYEMMGERIWVHLLVKDICLLFVLFLCVFEMRTKRQKAQRVSVSLWPILLLIGCFSNFIYAGIFHLSPIFILEPTSFTLKTIGLIVSAVVEEYIFRGFLQMYLIQKVSRATYKNTIVIVLTSLCFSLMHVINFYGNDPLAVSAQLGYTFILGVVLSTISFSFSYPLVFTVLGHICFNFFNDLLFAAFYQIPLTWVYILFSVGIGIFCVVYSLIGYNIFYRRKREM